jgi:FkbM family methyltransferase
MTTLRRADAASRPGLDRKLLTRVLALTLRLVVPLWATDWLRMTAARSQSDSLVGRTLDLLLVVLRHRPLQQLSTFSLPDDSGITLAATDTAFARHLYWYGERELGAPETAWWRALCSTSNRILEVGANIGYYSVVGGLANRNAFYLAVEPHPASASIAQTNLALNEVANVRLLQCAVMGKPTNATMELALPDLERFDAAPRGAYLRTASIVGTYRSAASGIAVPVRPISDVLDELGGPVDLIKLDIEGLEGEVLGAAIDRILRDRPAILVEVLRGAAQLRAVLAQLMRAGYLAGGLTGRGLRFFSESLMQSGEQLPRHGSRDVLLICPDRLTATRFP